MSAECQDKAQLYAIGRDGTQYPIVGARHSATDLSVTDILWDGGTVWDGGPGATVCVATCTKGDQLHVVPGDMVCMSPNAIRVTSGDGGVLGIMTEGAYHANYAAESQRFDSPQWLKLSAGGAAVPTVTANLALDPFGATTADLVHFPATSGAQYSMLWNYRGCGNTGGDTIASVYIANADGGTTPQYLDLAWTQDTGLYPSAICTSSGAGDGGLLYTRCSTPWAGTSLMSASMIVGNFSQDGGSRPAVDVLLFGAQCEASSRHVTSYIPNDAPGLGDGFPVPAQHRYVDGYGAVLPFTVQPWALSMGTDVFVPATYDSSSQIFQAISNGTHDVFTQIVSGYDNNSPDFSSSTWWHQGSELVVGMYPTLLRPLEWNHFNMRYRVDGGVLTYCMNGACDAGALGDTFAGFVPTGQGFAPFVGDGGFWTVCGDHTGTHASFGICKNVCLSLNDDQVCQ